MKVFANTDVGLVRQLNEDDYCIAHNANDEWMAIVCDGIGGAKAGEVASHTAVMTMYEAFMKSPVFKKDRQVDNWIRENLNQANDFIYSKSLKNPNERGMGLRQWVSSKLILGRLFLMWETQESMRIIIMN